MFGLFFVVVGSWYMLEWARSGRAQRIDLGDTILEEDGEKNSKESTYYNIASIRNILLSLLRYKHHLPLELLEDHGRHSH